MSKRVALCIEALSVGGAEQMLVALANAFVERGHEVHMVCLTEAGELAPRLDSNVQLHVLHKKPGLDLALLPRLRACINHIDPYAINSHLWVANLWVRLALLGTDHPVVVTEHSRDSWKPFHYRLLDRWLARRTRELVAVSHDSAAFYKDQVGVTACQISVINNGVETARYAAGDGTALRYQWIKDAQHLMLRHLLDRGLDVRLLIVGEGELRHELEEQCMELELGSNVILAGGRSDIPDVLSALDVFILSSDREGHPLTALESQAAGTPVVLTNAGGSADAIADDGSQKGGVLVECDAKALADAVAELLADEQRRSDMAGFAKRYALSHFDRSRMVENYEAVLQELTFRHK